LIHTAPVEGGRHGNKKPIIAGSLLTVAVSLMLAAPTQAQYRTNVPEVLTPPPAPVFVHPHPAILSDFRQAYARNESPRIVVFWNREFTDEVTSTYEDYEKSRSSSQSNRIVTGQGFYIDENEDARLIGPGQYEDSVSNDSFSETASGSRRLRDPGRQQLGESLDWALDGPFTQYFVSTGTRLVDRNTAMRTLNDGETYGNDPDVQAIEAKAMLNRADLMMEILARRDVNSPTGMRFRVSITDVASGGVLTRIVTDAMPVQAPPQEKFVATDNGFEKVIIPPPPVSQEEVGEQLAADTMQALINAWR
jgi:hypothetical protein